MAATVVGGCKGQEGRLQARERARDATFAEGCKKAVEAKKRRCRTSQTYLRAIVDECDLEDTKAVAREIVKEAKNGNPKAWDWLGKYVLGNGKISLADLSAPSILARKG